MSEPQRLALHAAARRVLGEEEGNTLMALAPPANTDMATKQDLKRAEERLDARIDQVEAKLGARIDQVEAKLDARIDQVEAKLGARIDQVEAKIDGVAEDIPVRIAQSEARTRAYVWTVVVGTGVVLYVATVGTLIGAGALLLGILDVI